MIMRRSCWSHFEYVFIPFKCIPSDVQNHVITLCCEGFRVLLPNTCIKRYLIDLVKKGHTLDKIKVIITKTHHTLVEAIEITSETELVFPPIQDQDPELMYQ